LEKTVVVLPNSKIIPTSKTNQRGDRRARQNKNSGRGGLTALVSTLKTQLVGRQIISTVSTGAGGAIALVTLPLDPVALSDRSGLVAKAFERYKIVQMSFKWRSLCPSTFAGRVVMGVHDDATASAAPASNDSVLNLRNSREADVWKDFSVDYVPIDREKWYYVNTDPINDPRFLTQGTLYIVNTVAVTLPGNAAGVISAPSVNNFPVGDVTVEYHYLFDGATLVAD